MKTITYLVYKASTTELGDKSMTKSLLETSLMMIITICCRVVNPTHIQHCIHGIKHLEKLSKGA
jgi:hypothetical protein